MTSLTELWNLDKTFADLRVCLSIINRVESRRIAQNINFKDAFTHKELWRIRGRLARIEARHMKEMSPRHGETLARRESINKRLKKAGIGMEAIYYRMRVKGMSLDEALSAPRMIRKSTKSLGTPG